MKANESSVDRIIRLVIGLIVFYLGFFSIVGVGGIMIGIVGLVLIITGITGFCALYKLLGISTKKS